MFSKPLSSLLFTVACITPTAFSAPGSFHTRHDAKHRMPNGTWTNLAALPHPWQEHSTVALNHQLYIFGGVPAIGAPFNGNDSVPTLAEAATYSIKDNSWKMIAPMPSPLNHANAVAHTDGKIYVVGGLAPPPTDTLVWAASNASFVYDPQTGAWTDLPAVPAAIARGSAAMASYGDEIFLAGGMTLLELRPNYTQASVAHVEAYNTRTKKWRSLPPLPGARDHDGWAVVDGHKFYVIGGREQGQVHVRNTTFLMDLRNPAAGWKTMAPMPTARGGCTAGEVNGIIYVFGGEGNPDPGSNGVFPQVEAYDTRTDKWTKLPNMPHPRHGTVAAASDGGIYIPGGAKSISADAVDTFDVFRPTC